jgi:phosphatidylinositol alpha-1,6-mannosyltransferase
VLPDPNGQTATGLLEGPTGLVEANLNGAPLGTMAVRPRPRVLVATPGFPPMVGGAELLAHRVASNLRAFDVRVVTLGHSDAARCDADMTIEVARASRTSGERHSLKVLNWRVLYEAARFRPHVVLSIHVSLAPAALALRALNAPFVLYVHAKEFAQYPRVSRLAMRRADAIVAVSRYTASLAESAGAPKARIYRIMPGVDTVRTVETPGARSRDPMLITVSRLDEAYKGHDVILQALPLIRRVLPNASWVVIGDGPLRADIEAAAASLPEGAVRMLGRVSDKERDEWLGRAHVFVLPSRVPKDLAGGEGFGIAALEASAHGLPVVAGEHGGTADAVVDKETGLLVDATSAKGVAEAVLRLFGNGAEARRMGAAGRARARELSWERVGGDVGEVLRKVMAASGGLRRRRLRTPDLSGGNGIPV